VLALIHSGDLRLMQRLNRWQAPRWVRVWMLAATRGGDGWLWAAAGFAILLLGGPNRYRAAGVASVVALLAALLFLTLKRLAVRKRPCHVQPHCWATLLPPDRFSFPSGHTLMAFALAGSIAAFYPDISPMLYFCAYSIGLSRVLLGMHFLSDVIAGAVLGWWLAACVAPLLS